MNAQQKLAAEIESAQSAIRAVRPQISWTFTGETYIDAKDRLWLEATADSVPVWSRFNGENVVSNFDTFDIDASTDSEGREARADEVQRHLPDVLDGWTYSHTYELKRSDSTSAQHVHKFHRDGEKVYVRGFVSRVWGTSVTVGHELDFFA
ncbi:hypothetical protein SEA_SICARIUS2_77 [Arthrobacter phage Sicarius2]|uniref:Uncharacterized protein n=1 Tax=Arthrobacter phage Sicarius2 TaxID=2836090 RepID=A0A8F3INY2_9CAUD|nr:hypothetical protein SEA_SICARIUS2_77 [Arthrobacter phage Sicarius2]